MVDVVEGSLRFSFDDAHNVLKYDDSQFYCKQFKSIQYTKAVDIVCVTDDAAWLIEIKDYNNEREKEISLEDELVQKVRDTLAGLAAANTKDNNDNTSREIAAAALSRRSWRVVFHIEGLDEFTRDLPANLHIKLKRRLNPIDKKSMVLNMPYQTSVPWTVSRLHGDYA